MPAIGMKDQTCYGGGHDIRNDAAQVVIKGRCRECGTAQRINTTRGQWERWDNGQGPDAQACFPELSAAHRELLISGTCGKCWDEMWADVDDSGPPDAGVIPMDDVPAF